MYEDSGNSHQQLVWTSKAEAIIPLVQDITQDNHNIELTTTKVFSFINNTINI